MTRESAAASQDNRLIGFECCDCCEGTGHHWWRGRAEDGAEYAVESTLDCSYCDGKGYVEIVCEPVEMDERP